jgi:predicted transcriptional regulator
VHLIVLSMTALVNERVNTIMSNLDREQRDVVDRQERVLRLAERDHGLSISVLSAEAGLSESSLRSYKTGTAMPLHNAVKLASVLPDHLVSLWFEPAGKVVIDRASDEDALLDQLLLESTGYSAEHVERRADGVICPRDKEALRDRARRVAAVATKVACS